MDVEAVRLLAKAITTLTMGLSAIGEGFLIGKAFEAMGRNPDIQDKLFTYMIIGSAMAESTAIYALVVFFLLG